MIDYLDETNFLLYAAKNYDNPTASYDGEFFDDLKRIRYIKRLLNKYQEHDELKCRLILNHMTILANVFGELPAVKLLFLKLEGYEQLLKPFFIFLNIMPDEIKNIGHNKRTIKNDGCYDANILYILRDRYAS
jgi:hypothetical protein